MSENIAGWHRYPSERPEKADEYRVTVSCGYFNITSASVWKNGHFTDYEDEPGKIGSIIAWAYMPRPYKKESL